MPDTWIFLSKPSYNAELLALPAKVMKQIHKQLHWLEQDPTPDGDLKKRLKGWDGKVCRLRAGSDYRVLYAYEKPFISLLSVRQKGDHTYDEQIEGEDLGAGAPDIEALGGTLAAAPPQAGWVQQIEKPDQPPAKKPLPGPVTKELLRNLRIDKKWHAALEGVATEEDLLACPGVPEDVLLRVSYAVVDRPVGDLLAQPDLVVESLDNLVKFKEGELLGFLLKLNPEQEKYVGFALAKGGPTLLKGGPGTGKSTVAIYRVRTLIAALRKEGIEKPRILFTTYTNALVKFTEQLLKSLLGDDARLCEVRTADSVAMGLAGGGTRNFSVARTDALRATMEKALASIVLAGNALQRKAQQQALERLGRDYLLEEIAGVIDARRLATLDDYQAAKRPGRRITLNKTQREAVWRLRETYHGLLAKAGMHTWEEIRTLAADVVEGGTGFEPYDAVIIDEAQDLQPVALQMLVGLSRLGSRIFLTADANQSIYGSGFNWQDVHDRLKFQGRTGILKANHRSTREIGEAAQSYLTEGVLDDEEVARTYVNNGPLPAVRAVPSVGDEAQLLNRFLRSAAHELRLGVGSTAVLVPTEAAGKRIADVLGGEGLTATYMKGTELDLAKPGVKIITLKSAKGLEFPIVALAGFLDGAYPWVKADMSAEEADEIVARERRTMFVAMTRAMRALLVVVPTKTESPLLTGFAKDRWNLGNS